MARVKRGVTQRARHKRVLDRAEGMQGSRHRLHKSANEAVMHSLAERRHRGAVSTCGDPVGLQVEQDDTRTELGTNLRMSRTFAVGPLDVRATAGLQVREDAIEAQLHRTEQGSGSMACRAFLGPSTTEC